MTDWPGSDLPGVLADIARVVGEEVALQLAVQAGGTEVFVPLDPKPDSRVVAIIGIDAARRIAKEVAFGSVRIPRAMQRVIQERRRRVRALVAQGCSSTQIALELGVSSETVRQDKRHLGL